MAGVAGVARLTQATPTFGGCRIQNIVCLIPFFGGKKVVMAPSQLKISIYGPVFMAVFSIAY